MTRRGSTGKPSRDGQPEVATAGEPGRDPALREAAEAVVRHRANPARELVATLTAEAMALTLHELHVHQIELEMQNEELRRAHEDLDAARARYFDLYDLAPVGYCTVDEAGRILEANLTAATLLGVPRSAMAGQRISRYLFGADQDAFYLLRKRLVATGVPQACDLRLQNPDGTPLWAHLEAAAAPSGQGPEFQRLTFSTITARKAAEEALAWAAALQARHTQVLEATNAELERAKDQAGKANRAKAEFLSNMSHELLTPLHAMLGFTQLLDGGTPAPTPGQKASVDQVLKAGWHMVDLVNALLDRTKAP